MSKTPLPVNIVDAAITLYNETAPDSPYRKLATYSIYMALSTSERYMLSYIAKTGHVGNSPLAVALKIIQRLLVIEAITETTKDSDKRRKFAVTEFGRLVNRNSLVDIDKHFTWYDEQFRNGRLPLQSLGD